MEFLHFYDLAFIATVCNKKCWKFSRRKKSMQIGEKSSENYPRPPPAVWFRSRNWSLLLLFNCAVCASSFDADLNANLFSVLQDRLWSLWFRAPDSFLKNNEKTKKYIQFSCMKLMSSEFKRFHWLILYLSAVCTWFLTFSSLIFLVWWSGFFPSLNWIFTARIACKNSIQTSKKSSS